ncbi:MAG: molecular chaperone [Myxococcales bacterium]|nr:molecular chaperone [Myxococcales bacterium]
MKPSITFLFGLVVWVLAPMASAHAATFSVHPIKIDLSTKRKSELFAVRNTGHERLRFQITVHEWKQSRTGEVELAPTEDIVFYPRMLTLQGGEERNIRVGLARTFVSSAAKVKKEKTYRIIVEELPSHTPKAAGPQVRVLTKMSVPIFVSPEEAIAKPKMIPGGLKAGKFSFQLKNNGNAHTIVRDLKIKGLGKGKRPLFGKELQGWYLLADGVRDYDVDLPRRACGKVKTLQVEGRAGDEVFSIDYPLSEGACAPR